MSRIALGALLVCSCAEVPASACFFDEACADAGVSRTGGGGGSLVGGGGGGSVVVGGGGGSVVVGGGGGSTGGGSVDDGGYARTPITPIGTPPIADSWADVLGELPAVSTTLPQYDPFPAHLVPSISLASNCNEAFRGAILLTDGRVLAVPACTNRFAVIDTNGAGSAEWVGPVLGDAIGFTGHFGGAVLGCDGRVYALPFFDTKVTRVTLETNLTFTFDALPLEGLDAGRPYFFGGVIALPCRDGRNKLRIVTGGREALRVLDVYEDVVDVREVKTPEMQGFTFESIARVGDRQVVALASGAPGRLTVQLDPETLVVRTSLSIGSSPVFGLTPHRDGGAFAIREDGAALRVNSDAGVEVFAPPTMELRTRWATNSLTGWVFGAGQRLIAWRETSPHTSVVVADPATYDTNSFTSGGLVMTSLGTLVNVPGAQSESDVMLYFPAVIPTEPLPNSVLLSPWFNKL